MRKLKWIMIWVGLKFLKLGLTYSISRLQKQWLQAESKGGLINREAIILDYFKGKTVLQIGFAHAAYIKEKLTNGNLLHYSFTSVTAELFGIDSDKDAVQTYQQKTKDSNVAAIAIYEILAHEVMYYNLVLIGEVLEHIRNPSTIIEYLEQKIKNGQKLLVTVPNIIYSTVLRHICFEQNLFMQIMNVIFRPIRCSKKSTISNGNSISLHSACMHTIT